MPAPPTPASPLTTLKGVGAQLARKLEKLGLVTIQDVLFHLPYRYQDRTQTRPIAEVRGGEECVIQGVIEGVDWQKGPRKALVCALNDGTGTMVLRFFHYTGGQAQQLVVGTHLWCHGEARWSFRGLEMIHPEYRFQVPDGPAPGETELTPVYPTTEGVHQAFLRRLTQQALSVDMMDLLPASVVERQGFQPLMETLRFLHAPPPNTDTEALLAGRHPLFRRLAFEELLAHHLSLRILRHRAEQRSAPALVHGEALGQRLVDGLPFQLTGAQRRVVAEIRADLARNTPMQRLVQGDVGSGKTIVAALAAAQAVASGYQVAVMAPTELLAEQHWRNFTHWLEPLDIPLAWLSGSLTKKKKEIALSRIAGGEAKVVIGTHALFQEAVQFDRLGLIVVDEQHRFGVHQRLSLRDKGGDQTPHQLIMTATPIPRTLAMTAYADLDTSIIDELPPGRSPVVTVALPEGRRDEVIARVAQACAEGRQAYWVCPLIEESEVMQYQAAEETAARLEAELPEAKIGLVHGRMKGADKDAVLQTFAAGELSLLVATTVIEVGVDVPNAGLMIIENAERMGLAQLHQLRGRVGRGTVESFCVLLYQPPLSATAKRRLAVMRQTQDGFVIAQEDLELRGPGEILGTRQTGLTRLRIADLKRDQDLLPAISQIGGDLLRHHPEQVRALIERWVKHGLAYGEVY